MRIKISGFSTGANGNLGEKIWVLVASGKDIVLRAGDEIEIIRPTKRPADVKPQTPRKNKSRKASRR